MCYFEEALRSIEQESTLIEVHKGKASWKTLEKLTVMKFFWLLCFIPFSLDD
jgi:hypothetical protein